MAGIVNGKVECPNCQTRIESFVNGTREIFVEAALDSVFEVRVECTQY